MPRSRNIKPGFFKNEYLGVLDPLARLLFEGLWCLADREGRLEDRPLKIKAEILPYDNCDVDQLLNDLAAPKGELIERYEVDGEKYIQVINFKTHQNPHVKEAKSTIPPPDMEHSGNSTGQAPDEPDKSTGQEQDEHEENPADSLLLIPDIHAIKAKYISLCSIHAREEPEDNLDEVDELLLKRRYAYPDLEWWEAYFDRVFMSDFLMKRKNGTGGWRFTLKWLLENMDEVLSGKYDLDAAKPEMFEDTSPESTWRGLVADLRQQEIMAGKFGGG